MKKVDKLIGKIGKKAVVLAIMIIFVFSAFIPAVVLKVTTAEFALSDINKEIEIDAEESASNNGYNTVIKSSEVYESEKQINTFNQSINSIKEPLPLSAGDPSSSYFNWSSTSDWENGTSSQVYIRNGVVGIGGYDDFEDYSIGSLPPQWEERITENIWVIVDNSGDNCLYHPDGSEHTGLYSEMLTPQWGNLSNFSIQAKYVDCGSSSNTYLVGRVDYDTNTQMSDRNGYGCRNAQPQNQRDIFEWYGGTWHVLTSDSDDISGDIYEKLMITGGDSDPDLYAKYWPTISNEPTSWHLTYTGGTNYDSLSGVPGMGSWSDSGSYYVSDFWLIGGWNNGNHTTEWKDADQSVYWNTFSYTAANISSGDQDVNITIEVSDDAITPLDSLSFYADNGNNNVDISSLPKAQYIRVITDLMTTDETKTAEISSYSIEYQTTPLRI